jgi:putative transposase
MKINAPESRAVESSVGIDLGIKVFAYQSDNIVVPNPAFARKAENKMRVRQRALARCKRGSNRRKKVKTQLIRLHAKIAHTRSTWLHQQSARVASSYDLIAIEDLNVRGMIRHPRLARSISDVSWASFIVMLSYKAERAGSTLVKVNPRNTSQQCSSCGDLVPKPLTVRTHSCPSCGLEIDRDHNASLNILQAVAGLGQHNVIHRDERAAGKLAPVRDATQQEMSLVRASVKKPAPDAQS